MNYDFTGKSIKCETWEQMLHLAKLAEEQGRFGSFFSDLYFNDGAIYFIVMKSDKYTNEFSVNEYNVEVPYSDFIKTLPTETIEVARCGSCPLYTKLSQHDYQYCKYPNEQQSCQMHVDMFTNCPLKKSSITIKLKHND